MPNGTSRHGPATILALIAACALAPTAPAQECNPYWAHLPGPHPGGFIQNIVSFDDGAGPVLYLSGLFSIGTQDLSGVYRRADDSWQRLDAGMPEVIVVGPVQALDDGAGPRLYLGVRTAKGQEVRHLRWNGHQWQQLPASFLEATPLISFDDGQGMRIYGRKSVGATGGLQEAVRWDGASWTAIGRAVGSEGLVQTMVVFNDGTGDALYCAGSFLGIGNMPARRIARWNGLTWSALGAGLPREPRQLIVYNDGRGDKLCALGGDVSPSGEVLVCIWDGQSWSDIGGSSSPGGQLYQINAMAVFDDGSGPALYVGGSMPSMGGVYVRGSARWNGSEWSPLGGGNGSAITQLTVGPDPRGRSLFAIGTFNNFGGGQAGPIAQWVGCPSCYANCDVSTVPPVLNVSDFVCFVNKFAARDPYANCTVDAVIDVQDFGCFMSKFAAGCP